jgi:sugar phosphate isomerase/epimerase
MMNHEEESAVTEHAMPELVYWAANSMPHEILARAEAVVPNGYAAMSCMVGDLAAWEASGRTIKQLRGELDTRGVGLSTIDPYLAWYPGFDPDNPTGVAAKYGAPHLVMSEDKLFRWADGLGARNVSTLGTFDGPTAPFEQAVEALGAFADRAAAHGLRPHLEPIPTTKVHDLGDALALVQAVDRTNLGLLLDTYNLGRAGVDPAELDAVPLELVFQLQLADGAGVQDPNEEYFADAFFHRGFAGEGEFGCAEMIARLARKGQLPPSGPEVLNGRLLALAPVDAGRVAAQATRRFFEDVFALDVANR